MDYFPRVPAYNCLNLVQVTLSFNMRDPGWMSDFVCEDCSLILVSLSGNCSFVVCSNDYSRPHCSFYLGVICTSPSLVFCTSISWVCREIIWTGIRGYCGAWLDCAGISFSCFSMFPDVLIDTFSMRIEGSSNLKFLHVQLAGPNRPIALAEANAVLNRIDLVCEVYF